MNQPVLTLKELLHWSDESTCKWLSFLAATPAAQVLPCGIYGTANILGLVRHIVAVEMRHSQRLADLPVTPYAEIPLGPLELFRDLHTETIARIQSLLEDPAQDWAERIDFQTVSLGVLHATRRKIMGHAILHGIRHWAQVSTLIRAAGFQPGIGGDLMVSSAME